MNHHKSLYLSKPRQVKLSKLFLNLISMSLPSPTLLRDIGQLFNNPVESNVLIEVGENDKKEIFYAHSAILIIRSSYFKSALSSVNDGFVLKKPKISPKAFRKILK